MSRPLEAYSSAVLAEFIRRRGIAFFPEELDFVELELADARREQTFSRTADPASPEPPAPAASPGPASTAARCPRCQNLGQYEVEGIWEYCDCPAAKELARAAAAVTRSKQPPQGKSPNEFRRTLLSYGLGTPGAE